MKVKKVNRRSRGKVFVLYQRSNETDNDSGEWVSQGLVRVLAFFLGISPTPPRCMKSSPHWLDLLYFSSVIP